MTPTLAMVVFSPRACNDSLPPCSDGNHPPREHGCNSFSSCPHCGKHNHPAKKCWKQFRNPPLAQVIVTALVTFSLALPNILALHFHMTLTLAKYDALHHFWSTKASS